MARLLSSRIRWKWRRIEASIRRIIDIEASSWWNSNVWRLAEFHVESLIFRASSSGMSSRLRRFEVKQL